MHDTHISDDERAHIAHMRHAASFLVKQEPDDSPVLLAGKHITALGPHEIKSLANGKTYCRFTTGPDTAWRLATGPMLVHVIDALRKCGRLTEYAMHTYPKSKA